MKDADTKTRSRRKAQDRPRGLQVLAVAARRVAGGYEHRSALTGPLGATTTTYRLPLLAITRPLLTERLYSQIGYDCS